MTEWIILALLGGVAVGGVIGLVVGRSGAAATAAARAGEVAQARADTALARQDAARAQADMAGAQADTAEARQMAAEFRADAEAVKGRLAEAQATAAAAVAQRDAAQQRVTDGARDREVLVAQFKALSADTLAEQGKRADATAEDRLRQTQALMQPVSENLAALQQRLTEVEKQRAALSAELRQQVNTVVATSENLRHETAILSNALRKPTVRGAWGETQLRRIVELAGMVDHVAFAEQETTHTAADDRIRPDMKVMLGQGKFCYVDSKVPLAAFLDAQDARDDDARAADLTRFATNVKTHIDQLSNKTYWKADLGSPEFVVLFIPTEALYAGALHQAPDLMEYAGARNIVLTSPTSLIGLLWAVAYGWKQSQLAESAAEIAGLGRELYDRVSHLGELADTLGRSLEGSVQAYNRLVGSLEARVMVTARKMGRLQVSTHDIQEVKPIDKSPRPISAPELLDDATQLPALLEQPRAA